MCLELGLIWLIYTVFGFIANYEMPVWAMAMVAILVDRTTSHITDIAAKRRKRLQD